MTLDDLETLLRAWGRAYGQRRSLDADGYDWGHTGAQAHPLAVAQQFAMGKRDKSDRIAWTPTQAAMLTKWAANGFRGRPPAWACEPVAGTPSRTSGARSLAQFDRTFTPELARVESAVMDLHRYDDLQACVVRHRYCALHDDAEAAQILRIPLRRFRDARKAGVVWLHGRLAA
jgi:hypothetical protein